MASAVSIFVLALTIALSWFYIRSLLKEDASLMSRVTANPPRRVDAARQPPRLGDRPDQSPTARDRVAAWGWSILGDRRRIAHLGVPRLLDGQLRRCCRPPTLESFIPTFLPFGGSFANYRGALADGSFFTALGISLVVTLIAVFFCLLFAFLASVAISRFRFRGRTSFVLAMLIVQMLPAEGLFIAQYKMISSVGLLEPIIGVSLIYIAAVVPFTIWMLRGFVAGVPAELEEAAMVDGLSRTQAFMRITFPLLAPGLVASGVFAFLQAWNEFTVALVLLPPSTCRRCRCGCAASCRRARPARPTGARSWPHRRSSPCRSSSSSSSSRAA